VNDQRQNDGAEQNQPLTFCHRGLIPTGYHRLDRFSGIALPHHKYELQLPQIVSEQRIIARKRDERKKHKKIEEKHEMTD
jgi:hypothetical protein